MDIKRWGIYAFFTLLVLVFVFTYINSKRDASRIAAEGLPAEISALQTPPQSEPPSRANLKHNTPMTAIVPETSGVVGIDDARIRKARATKPDTRAAERARIEYQRQAQQDDEAMNEGARRGRE